MRKKFKFESYLLIALTLLTVISSAYSPKIFNETYISILKNKARGNIKTWGIPGPIGLDPGEGGGGGTDPAYHFSTFLSCYTDDVRLGEVYEVDTFFIDDGYYRRTSTSTTNSAFIENLSYANSQSTYLAMNFIGHGTITSNGPALMMRNDEVVSKDRLEELADSTPDRNLRFVYLSSCYSLGTESTPDANLAQGFNKLGAKVVIGYTGAQIIEVERELANIFYNNVFNEYMSVEDSFTKTSYEYNRAISWADIIYMALTLLFLEILKGILYTVAIQGLYIAALGVYDLIQAAAETLGALFGLTGLAFLAVIALIIMLVCIIIVLIFLEISSEFHMGMMDFDTNNKLYL